MSTPTSSGAIGLVESAYDLESPTSAWLLTVLEDMRRMLGFELPAIATTFTMQPDGNVAFDEMQALGGDHVVDLFEGWQAHIPPGVRRSLFRPGVVGTVSALTRNVPGMFPAMQEYWGPVGIADSFGLTALDVDGQGVVLNAGLPEPRQIDPTAQQIWQQVCVHITAGHRLRRALARGADHGPDSGEALIDATTMKVAHAEGDAREDTARDRLRSAALAVDRARTDLRDDDPEVALAMWKGLVDGRWSLVDWFDADGRRYMVARRNSPAIGDPRGLTARERQVVAYTVLGESNKLIAYRLGLAQSTVSAALGDALRKLGLQSRTQLVQMLAVDPTP